jgi:hypothetical protein
MNTIMLLVALGLNMLLTPGPSDAQWGKVPTIALAAMA